MERSCTVYRCTAPLPLSDLTARVAVSRGVRMRITLYRTAIIRIRTWLLITGMVNEDLVAEAGELDVGVDLRRGDVGMSEHVPDGGEGGAAL